MIDSWILIIAPLVIYYLFGRSLSEGFDSTATPSVVKHGVAVTTPPPELPQKGIPWKDHYADKNWNVHKIAHAPILTNAFPMEKPPPYLEKTLGDVRVDVARPQFVPMMAKRRSSRDD